MLLAPFLFPPCTSPERTGETISDAHYILVQYTSRSNLSALSHTARWYIGLGLVSLFPVDKSFPLCKTGGGGQRTRCPALLCCSVMCFSRFHQVLFSLTGEERTTSLRAWCWCCVVVSRFHQLLTFPLHRRGAEDLVRSGALQYNPPLHGVEWGVCCGVLLLNSLKSASPLSLSRGYKA